MAQNLSGIPKAVVDIADKSVVFTKESLFIVCVQGETARGKVHEPVYVRNKSEYLRKLGGRIDGSDFPLYCMRMLDGGVHLWVSRVGHYHDAADKTSLEGIKANARVGEVTSDEEVLATADGSITAAGATGDKVRLFVDEGNGQIQIGYYEKQAGDSTTVIAAGLMNSLIGGYTGENTGASFTVTAPFGTGEEANSFTASVEVTGSLTATVDATFAGGTEPTENAVYFIAEEVGAGYNGSVVQVVAASSGVADLFDVKITLQDSDVTNTVKNLKLNPSVSEIAEFNLKLKQYGIQIEDVRGDVTVGTATFAGGVQDIANIVDQDYIGSSSSKIGWYSFGKVKDAFRIANINVPSPAVDIALQQYVASREDMRFHIAAPIGATPEGAMDYRMGTGAYSHTPISDWKGSLWAGQVNITDPDDSTRKLDIPAIVDFLIRRVKCDNENGPWISAAGFNRGRLTTQNNGVGDVNFADPENVDAANSAFTSGVNAIINDPTYGATVWGNKSLESVRSKLLNAENVADLAMYIKRRLEPLVKTALFDPNDPTMWKQVYRNVLPFITKELEAGRAIVPGEGTNWFWMGDQNADKRSDATFNTIEDLNAGIFRARFVFIPIRATEFIGIEAVITDDQTLVNIVQL